VEVLEALVEAEAEAAPLVAAVVAEVVVAVAVAAVAAEDNYTTQSFLTLIHKQFYEKVIYCPIGMQQLYASSPGNPGCSSVCPR
jgi:hypothetical protein